MTLRVRPPWLLLLLWNPAAAFNWYRQDDPERIDHGKVMPDVVTFLLLGFVWAGRRVDWWLAVIVVSAAFGYGMFRAFLTAKLTTGTFTDTTATTVNEQITRTILERRDAREGVEPTP